MPENWVKQVEGVNKKFYRETLLNYALNRWGLNKASSVGPTSELIRACSPNSFEQWQDFYFENAFQKKKGGIKITKEYLDNLGSNLYIKLSEVVTCELGLITEPECIDYVYNLVLNRTYEGYRSEVDTIYGQLRDILGVDIDPACDDWDRKYNVDFYIKIKDKFIGLQIKPISTGKALDQHQWDRMHERSHQKFENDFGGKVFFIYSIKSDSKKKKIYNMAIIEDIKREMEHLNNN